MATSGKAFGISLAIYFGIFVILFVVFSYARLNGKLKKFYAPKRFIREPGFPKPRRLRNKLWAWVPHLVRMPESEVIRCASIDAALYLRVLGLWMRIFVWIIIVVGIVILPINSTGGEVTNLMREQEAPTSQGFAYWVPPSPPPGPPGSPSPSPSSISAPDFFESDTPPAPPGVTWWEYKADVPPLADPETLLGPDYARYGWKYDSDYKEQNYHFTNLDRITLSNIADKSKRLYAHAIFVWVVTGIVLYHAWKFNREAIRLRVFYLLTQPPGVETHSVLYQDVPGVEYGTMFQRFGGGVLTKVLTKKKKKKKEKTTERADRDDSTADEAETEAGGKRAEGEGAGAPGPSASALEIPTASPSSSTLPAMTSSAAFEVNPAAGADKAAVGERLEVGGQAAATETADASGAGAEPGTPAISRSSATTSVDSTEPVQLVRVPDVHDVPGLKGRVVRAAKRAMTQEAPQGTVAPWDATAADFSSGEWQLPAPWARMRARLDGRVTRGPGGSLASYASDDGAAGAEGEALPGAAPSPAEEDAKALEARLLQPQSRHAMHEAVFGELSEIHGPPLLASHVAYDTSSLDPLVAEYDARKQSVEDLVDDCISKLRRGKEVERPKVRVWGRTMGKWGAERYGNWTRKTDALTFYSERLTYLGKEMRRERREARARCFPTAFATFKTRAGQAAAVRALTSEDTSCWTVRSAPRPADVVWRNLGARRWERELRATGMAWAFLALTLFFLIPVAAVQALMTTNSLVSFMQRIQIINAIVTSILPGLALKIFLALVPGILTLMALQAREISYALVDVQLVTRYFYFQVVTVFFGSIIAGSFFNQIKQFAEDPGSIVTVLGTAAPQTALFFMNYLLIQAVITSPLSLLSPIGAIIYLIKLKLAATARAQRRVWSERWFSYGPVVPNVMIGSLIGVSFSLICPLVPVFALIFFAIKWTISKYDLVYIVRQKHQTGGTLWKPLFNQIMTSLIIFQIIMIALLAIKKTIGPPIIIIPAPIITWLIWISAHEHFWAPLDSLSLISAAQLDAHDEMVAAAAASAKAASAEAAAAEAARPDEKATDPADLAADPIAAADPAPPLPDADHYVSPAFVFDWEAHRKLLDDVRRLSGILDGETDPDFFEKEEVDKVPEDWSDEEGLPELSAESTGGAAHAQPEAKAADQGEAEASDLSAEAPSEGGRPAAGAEART